MHQINQVVLLLKQYFTGTHTASHDSKTIQDLVRQYPALQHLIDELDGDEELIRAIAEYGVHGKDPISLNDDPVLQKILLRIRSGEHKQLEQRPRKMKWLAVAAAACLIIGAFSLLLYFHTKSTDTTWLAQDIQPGANKATLSLSDGTHVELDETHEGIVSGEQIRYADGTSVVQDGLVDKSVEIKLTVPRGGQYNVTLPDGTKVWLNSDSELSYPNTFIGSERKVSLKGEAYFEVIKDPTKPFVVNTAKESIQVLGTHFNVQAYAAEDLSAVTLVEGKVKVSAGETSDSRILRPGQQSQNDGRQLVVQKINLEEALAWKNGEFMFNDEDLESAMRKVARWYDIEVEIDPVLYDIHLWGTLPRSEGFDKILKLIQATNEKVHVRVEGRRIKLMK